MKHLKLLLSLLVAANMVFVSSCKKDEEDTPDPTTPQPTLTVVETSNSGTEFTVAPNTALTFAWNAIKPGGGKDLETFAVSISGVNTVNPIPTSNAGNDFPYDIKNADDEQYVDTLLIPGTSSLNEGITTYTFTATDKDGNSTSVSIKVTVEIPVNTTPMNVTKTGELNNLIGPFKSGWDLVNDVAKGSSDPDDDIDMQNTTTVSSTSPEIFEKEWVSKNATNFVKVTGFDYDNATVEAAALAYAGGGTPITTVSNVANGDMYIANVRGASDVMVIKVTNVVVTTTDNEDKIEFEYKKYVP